MAKEDVSKQNLAAVHNLAKTLCFILGDDNTVNSAHFVRTLFKHVFILDLLPRQQHDFNCSTELSLHCMKEEESMLLHTDLVFKDDSIRQIARGCVFSCPKWHIISSVS